MSSIPLICRSFYRQMHRVGKHCHPDLVLGTPCRIELELIRKWGAARFYGRTGNYLLVEVEGYDEPLVVVQRENRANLPLIRRIRSQMPLLTYGGSWKDSFFWQPVEEETCQSETVETVFKSET